MAPVTEEYDPKVWVIHREYDDGDTSLVEAHVSYESALAGMKAMGHIKVDLQELQLKSVIDVDAPKKKSKKSSGSSSSSKKSKKVKDSDNEDENDDDSTDSEGSTKAKDERQTLPDLSNARPNALKGLKVVFVGNFDKVRKIMQATAVFSGAVPSSGIKTADVIVLGNKPTPKQLKAIEETLQETYTEQEFYNMLETGFSKQKRQHSVSSESDDEAPRKKHKK